MFAGCAGAIVRRERVIIVISARRVGRSFIYLFFFLREFLIRYFPCENPRRRTPRGLIERGVENRRGRVYMAFRFYFFFRFSVTRYSLTFSARSENSTVRRRGARERGGTVTAEKCTRAHTHGTTHGTHDVGFVAFAGRV